MQNFFKSFENLYSFTFGGGVEDFENNYGVPRHAQLLGTANISCSPNYCCRCNLKLSLKQLKCQE